MTRAVSHFVEVHDVKFHDIYHKYLEYYESNKKRFGYKLAFITRDPTTNGLILTFEIPPGRYPVMLNDRVYNITQPWQYVSMAWTSTGMGRWESNALSMSYTTRQCSHSSRTKSYLPPLLPNYDYGSYCMGWTHEVYQSSGIDHMICAVNNFFGFHFGLAINMDLFRFTTEWLWFAFCKAFMNQEDYEYWTANPASWIAVWTPDRSARYGEVLALLETVPVDWFLKDLSGYKTKTLISVIFPSLASRYYERYSSFPLKEGRQLADGERPWTGDLEYHHHRTYTYLFDRDYSPVAKRYHRVFPDSWNFFNYTPQLQEAQL